MAIAPTGAIYKALEFDGVSSRTYGVYITGAAVYNAPQRDVEMIAIPGRNGSFALDKGRFENIEVSYPAGIFADAESDFAEAVSDFRNFLCSRNGYVRLQDEYNPNEYRLAVYKSGLEVEPALLRAGEFNIVFECKPQRFLTSGETAVTVTSGDTLTNPTLFEASPLIECKGTGNININSNQITINNLPIGDVSLASAKSTSTATVSSSFNVANAALLNPGDTITVASGCSTEVSLSWASSVGVQSVAPSISGTLPNGQMYASLTSMTEVKITATIGTATFAYGTSSYYESTISVVFTYYQSGTTYTKTCTYKVRCSYDGNNTITLSITNKTGASPFSFTNVSACSLKAIKGTSTRLTTTDTLYIDLDIGEAYIINSGTITSINDIVSMPSKLPTLKPGTNTINYANTVTNFKITPRWWKI